MRALLFERENGDFPGPAGEKLRGRRGSRFVDSSVCSMNRSHDPRRQDFNATNSLRAALLRCGYPTPEVSNCGNVQPGPSQTCDTAEVYRNTDRASCMNQTWTITVLVHVVNDLSYRTCDWRSYRAAPPCLCSIHVFTFLSLSLPLSLSLLNS